MLWVTWRQHRGLLISVLVVFAAAVAAMLVYGQRIHHDYAILTACRPAASPACQGLSSYFNSTDWHLGNYLQVAVLAAPVLLSMFAGPPVVARDLENSTYRYAWTQGIGRVRWTVAKLVIIGAVVTIAAFVIGQLFAWFFAPFLTTEKLTVYTPSVFGHARRLLRRLDADRVLPRGVPRHARAQDPPGDGHHAGRLRRPHRADLV